jgi:hypothetical protein
LSMPIERREWVIPREVPYPAILIMTVRANAELPGQNQKSLCLKYKEFAT